MIKIVSFGEILLRIPFKVDGFGKEDKIYWGGAEANSICALSKWGNSCRFVSKVPAHKIGRLALENLQSYGVDTSFIVKGGERIGTYYYMPPSQYIAGEVVYDRGNSSVNNVTSSEFDPEKIFAGMEFFYVTGITLALGCIDEVTRLWDYAKSKGIKLVFDVNYRTKLWSLEDAKKVIPKFMKESDFLFASPFDIKEFLGVSADFDEYLYEKAAEEYDIEYIARLKRSLIGNNLNEISALLCHEGNVKFTDKYEVNIIERIGGGDSFVAGLLQGVFCKKDNPLQFALTSVLMKYSILGDVLNVDTQSIQENLGNLGLDVRR